MWEILRKPTMATLVALFIILITLAFGYRILQGDGSLLRDVSWGDALITPNADGDTDATRIQYTLARNATVSIFFTDDKGQVYYFRQERERGADEYAVLFSGVVDGYRLPQDQFQDEIQSRLLQDGSYTWTIAATDEDGVTETATGTLTIQDADVALPEMRDFSLDKLIFTPNRDGIDDRVQIQFALQKEAEVRVFLLTPDGVEWPIAELDRNVFPGQPGRHVFDYEGGVDNGATPPADGTYTIVAEAHDLEGQRMRREETLTIQYGGVPRADIVAPMNADTVQFAATAVALCDTLSFSLTIENYGDTPIRTTGPAPGTIYDSDWNYNTVGWHTESGAWRVAIGYENELSNYPYRWAVGSTEELTLIGEHYYLMPGQRAVVEGHIRITGPLGERNPQPMWAGLIHEDVEVSQFNNRVDPHAIQIDMPDAAHMTPCPEREVPTP